jgi:hypothetical protein
MLKVSLLVFGFCLLATPITLFAQDGGGTIDPPPICCPQSPDFPGGSLVIQGQFLVSTGMLDAQGITRKQFIDRLSATFFPDKPADVVLSTKTLVSQPSLNGPNARLGRQNLDAGGQGLIAIQETLYYRIPLIGLNAADFEGVEQLGLTDGTIQITVRFVKGTSLGSNTQ